MTNKTIKLYPHTTDGGAKYLFDTFVKWSHNGKSGKEGVINQQTKYIIRLDGEPELTIKEVEGMYENPPLEQHN